MLRLVLTLTLSNLAVLAQPQLDDIELYGEGQEKFVVNQADEPVLALLCSYELTTRSGEVRQNELRMRFVGLLMRGDEALKPHQEYQLLYGPLRGPNGTYYQRRNVKVIGAVFQSGAAVGPAGERLLNDLKDEARETRRQIREILRKLRGLPRSEVERLVTEESRLVRGRKARMVHHDLKKILLGDGELRPDYLPYLRELASYLANF